jgi:hypothetical protein
VSRAKIRGCMIFAAASYGGCLDCGVCALEIPQRIVRKQACSEAMYRGEK